MARKCQITGARAMYGNHVSHANNKTRRRQEINLQAKRLWDAEMGRWVKVRLTAGALRTIDKAGGLAGYRRNRRKRGKQVTV